MPTIDLSNIPDAPNVDLSNIPGAFHRGQKDITPEQSTWAKDQMNGAYETAKDIGHVYPILETTANVLTSLYGIPISGLAGILSSPANFLWEDANKKVTETVQDWLIYKPQTERGIHLSDATTYPFQKLDELGSLAGNKVLEKTNSPLLATAVHTAIQGAPALLGIRHIPKVVQSAIRSSTAWRQLTIKERGLIIQDLEGTIKKNPSMTEGEILRRWNGLKDEAYTKRGTTKPKTDVKAMEKIVKESEKEVTSGELESAFNRNKEIFFQNRDEKLFRANVEARLLQKELKSTLGIAKYKESVKDTDRAIQIHIDSKRNPAHIEKYYDRLTDKQKAIVDLSKDLPDEILPIVDKIQTSYRETGIEALDAEIIRNVLDNYAARVWDLGNKPVMEVGRKFGTKTRHAKQRVFETVIEGWANGYELKVEGAINNLKILKEEITKTIENRKLLKALQNVKDPDGNKLITDKQLEGYKRIEHPNFVSWKWATAVNLDTTQINKATGLKVGDWVRAKDRDNLGKISAVSDEEVAVHFRNKEKGTEATVSFPIKDGIIEKDALYKVKPAGKNFFIDDDGNIFERRSLYAPKKQADNLNNIFGVSKLKDVPSIPTITKYNAIAKSWILQTSLFHHLAFLRSYYLPGLAHKKWSELTPRSAFKKGIEAIERSDPIVIQGVRNGLTLGLRQDWDESLLREKTKVGQILDKTKATKEVKDAIIKAREMQSDWLFGELGASLKAKTFIVEYRSQLKKHPDADPDAIAKDVATLINDDFGGLHLERLGRDPTLQHILRILLLAPDWTESNVRTMLKVFPIGKDGNRFYTSKAAAKMYRKFWLGVLLKGMGATTLLNFLLAGGDTPKLKKNYEKAWKAGNLKILGVDVTPIYKALGGDTPDRKYFYLIGHFRDPVKFVTHPVRSAHHKGSVAYGIFHEALAGSDWAGRDFTTFDDLLNDGKTVEWFGKGGPIEWNQLPSYLISEFIGTQPIQIQNGLSWLAGEQEGFDAIANSLGLGISTTHKKASKKR